MCKFKKTMSLILLFLTGYTYADDGVYVSLGAGIGKVLKAKSNQDFPLLLESGALFPSPIDSITLSFKKGVQLNGAIGYQWGNYRGELALSFLKAKYNKFDQKPDPLMTEGFGGFVRSITGFVNGYYDFNFNKTFVPFLGTGIGYARIKNRFTESGLVVLLPSGSVVPLPSSKFDMKDNSLAYQIIPGIKVNLTDNLGITADYRFYSTTKKMRALNSRLKAHTINVGLMYKF